MKRYEAGMLSFLAVVAFGLEPRIHGADGTPLLLNLAFSSSAVLKTCRQFAD